jgi:hypothetical protein
MAGENRMKRDLQNCVGRAKRSVPAAKYAGTLRFARPTQQIRVDVMMVRSASS